MQLFKRFLAVARSTSPFRIIVILSHKFRLTHISKLDVQSTEDRSTVSLKHVMDSLTMTTRLPVKVGNGCTTKCKTSHIGPTMHTISSPAHLSVVVLRKGKGSAEQYIVSRPPTLFAMVKRTTLRGNTTIGPDGSPNVGGCV
jgi:hypothetical protein